MLLRSLPSTEVSYKAMGTIFYFRAQIGDWEMNMQDFACISQMLKH